MISAWLVFHRRKNGEEEKLIIYCNNNDDDYGNNTNRLPQYFHFWMNQPFLFCF